MTDEKRSDMDNDAAKNDLNNKNTGELAENDLKQVAGGLTIKKVTDISSPTFQNGVATGSHLP